MAHIREQKGRGKHETWKRGPRPSRLGARLCLLSVIGVWWLLALSLTQVQAAPFAYIANSRDNNVSVIDTATNAVVATVPVGMGPHGIAVHPAGTFVELGSS